MIYLTPEELSAYYGSPMAGPGVPVFNEDKYESRSDNAFKYRFGLLNGRCVYAIIMKKAGGFLSLAEAYSFRSLNGKGTWKFMSNLLPEENAEEIEKIFADRTIDLGWSYTPSTSDQFQHPIFCSHQAHRRQLVVWHPKWHVDLSIVAASGI